nr:hypothetical protein [Tanacetum cinerariifolium]
YEVQGDQTPPPRDESSDSDSEPEAEEADDEAEDADDELEVEEAGRTKVAFLGSEVKIGKMEREILHHDLSSVEETLGKVV